MTNKEGTKKVSRFERVLNELIATVHDISWKNYHLTNSEGYQVHNGLDRDTIKQEIEVQCQRRDELVMELHRISQPKGLSASRVVEELKSLNTLLYGTKKDDILRLPAHLVQTRLELVEEDINNENI